MHVISNETALAHWQALNRLPPSALQFLVARFLREQPTLASALLPLEDSSTYDANDRLALPEFDDPKMADFWRMAAAGAVINEIMCREAGRPLRKLAAAEVEAVMDATCDRYEKARGAEQPGLNDWAEVIKSSTQRHLLTGAILALSKETGRDRVKLPRESLELSILVEALHRACGDEPATTPRSWDAERIQFALATQGDPLRREALAVADGFRARLVTDFLQELDWWAAEPKEAALEEDGSLGMHALFLLAKWREESAWPVFRKLFSLPGDIGYDLLGDLITEDGSILLAMAGGQRQDELRAMVEDESLDEYCRNACIDALTCLVVWGELPRAEHVAWLRELLAGKLRDVPENEHTYGGVVSAACDLEAWELRPEIEAAYERGVVDDGFIDLKFFLDCQAGKHRSQRQSFCDRHQPITDVAAATKWLDNPPPRDEPPLPPLDEDLHNIADSTTPYIAPPKVGRNDPCPCGSGKKYKKGCGA
jgi:hypothetical protein